MFCTRCGREIPNNANTCEYCGNVVNRTNVNQGDAPSGIFAVLSFFIPLVGLILFLVYHDSHPRKAKSAGKGAIAGFITSIVLSILAVVLYVFLIGTIIQKTTDYIYDDQTEIWE